MSPHPEPLDSALLLRVLGAELRAARKRRGWIRRDVQARLVPEVSLQTLATYELGTRGISVVRFVEVCDVLEESAPALLGRSLQLTRGDRPELLPVDLSAVIRSERVASLTPLWRWAVLRLQGHSHEGDKPLVYLSQAALEQLAELCGLTPAELLLVLRELTL